MKATAATTSVTAADDLTAQVTAGEIALVAHGGTLRVLSAYLSGIPVERTRWEPLANGCILQVNPQEKNNR